MIKPDAVQNGYIGPILEKITASGFKIVALKLTKLSLDDAKKFYSVHEGKPFFERLINFMSSGPIVAAILEKENAVADFRNLIGATNPENAADGTIRKLYATSLSYNAIHGADSNENAAIESAFHFSDTECF
jgi:nucleoside-diphosphate kinase